MEKDKWINDIIDSTKGMQRAEPSPFVFEQITAKLSNKVKPIYSSESNSAVRWGLAFLVSAIILVNMISLIKVNVRSKSTVESSMSESVNELDNATIYSY